MNKVMKAVKRLKSMVGKREVKKGTSSRVESLPSTSMRTTKEAPYSFMQRSYGRGISSTQCVALAVKRYPHRDPRRLRQETHTVYSVQRRKAAVRDHKVKKAA